MKFFIALAALLACAVSADDTLEASINETAVDALLELNQVHAEIHVATIPLLRLAEASDIVTKADTSEAAILAAFEFADQARIEVGNAVGHLDIGPLDFTNVLQNIADAILQMSQASDGLNSTAFDQADATSLFEETKASFDEIVDDLTYCEGKVSTWRDLVLSSE